MCLNTIYKQVYLHSFPMKQIPFFLHWYLHSVIHNTQSILSKTTGIGDYSLAFVQQMAFPLYKHTPKRLSNMCIYMYMYVHQDDIMG